MNELRRLGATTLVAMEENDTQRSRPVDTPTLSSICDTLVELSVRSEGSMLRHLALRKSRVSRCDLRVREMVLTSTGVDLAGPEGTLAG
jgi:circadian clock protein KaiC